MKIKKYQNPAGVLPSATTKAYLTGLKDYLFGTTKSFDESTYKPTIGAKRDKYYTRPGLKEEVVLNLLGGMDKDNPNAVNTFGEPYFYQNFDDVYNTISKTSNKILSRTASNGTLGRYAISAGNDDNGRYISFSDTFDHAIIPGKGIPIYDRIYEDEFNKLYNSNKSALREGDWISRSPILKKMLQQGGSIKYISTESQTEIPEIQGYKKQFPIQLPRGEEEKSPQIIYVQVPQEQNTQEVKEEVELPVRSEWSDIKSIIKNNEGFISRAKKSFDEPHPTVGYGFFNILPDGRRITDNMTITEDEADKQLDIAIDRLRNNISSAISNYNMKISDNQLNVLVDLGYHGGIGLVTKLLRESNGDTTKIPSLLSRYATKAKYGDTSITNALIKRAKRRVDGWNRG